MASQRDAQAVDELVPKLHKLCISQDDSKTDSTFALTNSRDELADKGGLNIVKSETKWSQFVKSETKMVAINSCTARTKNALIQAGAIALVTNDKVSRLKARTGGVLRKNPFIDGFAGYFCPDEAIKLPVRVSWWLMDDGVIFPLTHISPHRENKAVQCCNQVVYVGVANSWLAGATKHELAYYILPVFGISDVSIIRKVLAFVYE